jgi:hypothetical protein
MGSSFFLVVYIVVSFASIYHFREKYSPLSLGCRLAFPRPFSYERLDRDGALME